MEIKFHTIGSFINLMRSNIQQSIVSVPCLVRITLVERRMRGNTLIIKRRYSAPLSHSIFSVECCFVHVP